MASRGDHVPVSALPNDGTFPTGTTRWEKRNLAAEVPVWDIRDTTPVSDLLVRNELLGKSLATALGDKPVVLMRGHGDVVVGRTVQNAVVRAIYTEVNARVLTAALGLGGSINYISAEEGAQRDRQPGDEMRAWNLWKDHAMKK